MMTLVIGAVLLTLAVLLYHWQESPASEEFVEAPRFRIWAVLLCIQSALWVILTPPTWKSLRSLYSDFGADRRMLVGIATPTAAIIALVVGFELFSSSAVPDYPLADHPMKLRILTGVGFLVALSALAGMWLVEAASSPVEPISG